MTDPKILNLPTKPSGAAALRTGLTGFAIGLCLTGWMAASNDAMAQGTASCTQDFSWNDPPASAPPGDICGSGDLSKDFYAFSWQVFKFLVWPASPGRRGIPDATKKITDDQGPRTFESLKSGWEIFRPDAQPPLDWNAFPGIAEPCSNHINIAPGALVLAAFNEFGNVVEGEPGPNSVHVLVAQNGSYVRYLAAFNETVFGTIRDNRLYNRTVARNLKPPQHDEAIPSPAVQPDGALTVKSAWIELPGPKPIDPSRFYVRRSAWVQNPETRECRMADVGLVGLHIVYKSHSRPQWIWSTFEHVDNAPEPLPELNRTYTFNDGSNTPMTRDPGDDYRIPLPKGANGPGDPPRSYQVQRLQRINPEAADLNRIHQQKLDGLGSVWKNYKLVTAQWPTLALLQDHDARDALPKPACSGPPPADSTANTTMETFFQARPNCGLNFTCMGCHDMNRTTDSIWSIMLNHNKPAGTIGPGSRSVAIRALQELLDSLRTK